MLEHAVDDHVSAKGPYDKQWSGSAVVPCSHDEVGQTADVVEVVMRDEHGIKILGTNASPGKLSGGASPCVEEQRQPRCLNESGWPLSHRIWARASGSE
jgi:hypothetical protein